MTWFSCDVTSSDQSADLRLKRFETYIPFTFRSAKGGGVRVEMGDGGTGGGKREKLGRKGVKQTVYFT